MAVSKAQQKAVTKYVKNKYDRFGLTMPKGKLDTIKAHAEANSESVNGFIGRAIDETMERDNAAVSGSAAQACGDTLLTPKALTQAQAAAKSAGETVPEFIERAVETQAKRDDLTRKLEQAK